ncbi:MAG: hypothetical protein Q8K86_08295 [Candidatus Nanopelagicaceae bacterium]|nr:hypothetical protein [Candidatus Nanopelagicaceae bacterium]
MPINQVTYGRFNTTDPVIKDNKVTYGLWSRPEFLRSQADDDVYYIVDNTKEGRIDLIANEVYGTPHLSWIIPAAMHQIDCLNWPTTGTALRLPSPSRVFAEV